MRSKLLAIGRKKTTPLYVYDAAEVRANLARFKKAFGKSGLRPNVFYAIKSNPYLDLLKTVVQQGENLDASSQRELKLALQAKSKKIIYTGPAKTKTDCDLIAKHASKITVNLDNFGEIQLLARAAKEHKKTIRCGVRVFTPTQSGWSKFGIPLAQLREFYDQVQKYPSLDFCGIHFHISLNKNADRYVAMLRELASYLRANFSKTELEQLKYVDVGGGFYPEAFEAIPAWNPGQIMDFGNGDDAYLQDVRADKFQPRYLPIKVDPIEKVAAAIAAVWKSEIAPLLPNVELYTEPGRFISHSAMHFLLRVADIKNGQNAILDGGTNMVGWEKYQFFYYVPIFNLSNFSLTKEQPFILYGSLCTPDDLWGYYFYGKKIAIDDLMLVPFQGAYTYTLAQNFIKEIPLIHNL